MCVTFCPALLSNIIFIVISLSHFSLSVPLQSYSPPKLLPQYPSPLRAVGLTLPLLTIALFRSFIS